MVLQEQEQEKQEDIMKGQGKLRSLSRARRNSRARSRDKLRDLHHVHKSPEINNSNNDLQEEAEHIDLFLFPLKQPNVEEQPAVDE